MFYTFVELKKKEDHDEDDGVISCILVDLNTPICVLSVSIDGGHFFFYVKEMMLLNLMFLHDIQVFIVYFNTINNHNVQYQYWTKP